MRRRVRGVIVPGWLCLFLFCDAGTPGRGFSCFPAGGTVCVCAFNRLLRKHFICSTVCRLYLHLSGEGLSVGYFMCTSDNGGPVEGAALTAPLLFSHSCRYLCCSLMITGRVCVFVGNVFFSVVSKPCIFLLCVCAIITRALNACAKKHSGKWSSSQ